MSVPARIDFGCIGQGWALFKVQSGVWMGAILLCFLIYVGLWVLLAIPTGGLTQFQRAFSYGLTHPSPQPSYFHPAPTVGAYERLTLRQVCEILLAGVNAVLTGGLYRMAIRQKRGETISMFGLFSALPQSLPLFSAGIVVPAMLGCWEGVCLWPLHRFLPRTSVSVTGNVYLALTTLLDGVLMFAPLLIVDAGANAGEAIAGSLRLLRGQMLRGVWFYIVASFVGGVGFVLCGVGMLATYPVFLISIVLAYLALSPPAGGTPELDPAPAGVWPPPPRAS